MFFANEQREKVREDNPGIKFGESALVIHSTRRVLTKSRRGWQDAW
jgi:hypothetical protein